MKHNQAIDSAIVTVSDGGTAAFSRQSATVWATLEMLELDLGPMNADLPSSTFGPPKADEEEWSKSLT